MAVEHESDPAEHLPLAEARLGFKEYAYPISQVLVIGHHGPVCVVGLVLAQGTEHCARKFADT
jgi:hypothetical protein